MLEIKDEHPIGSSYFAMRRFVMNEITRYGHPYPYVGGLVYRTTRNIAYVTVNHRSRVCGHSGYNLKSLFHHWLNGFTAFSVKPLEFGAYIGFGFAIVGFVVALITIVMKLVQPGRQAGWSSIISAILIIGGLIMTMLGLIGEYIGRIYICINSAPQYVIREVVCNGENGACTNG